jgi:hypothetical protein
MKIKALKDFQSAIVHMSAGDIREVELDDYTAENWVENGLIEIKGRKKQPVEVSTTAEDEKPVKTDDN